MKLKKSVLAVMDRDILKAVLDDLETKKMRDILKILS